MHLGPQTGISSIEACSALVTEFSKTARRGPSLINVYEMIYRETLDWQKFLARAISERIKQDT